MRSERMWIILLGGGLGLAVLTGGRAAPAAEATRPIAEIKRLDARGIAAAGTVRVRGVVTMRAENSDAFHVQDETDGLYVKRGADAGPPPADVMLGSEVEIVGRPEPGGYAPLLAYREVVPLGPAALPRPVAADPESLFGGFLTERLVEIEATVEGVREGPLKWLVTAAAGDRVFVCECRKAAAPAVLLEDPLGLVNARVRVAGVAGASYNTRGELLEPRLLVPRGDMFTVVAPAPHDPFTSPLVPLAGIARYRPQPRGSMMVRVEGVVVHAVPGEAIWLQEGPQGLVVATNSSEPVAVGDRVEACGFVRRTGRVASLAEALVRRVGRAAPLEPLAVSPDEIIAVNARSATRFVMAEPGDYDGCLIRFRARLVDRQPSPAGGRLLLAAGRTSVTAKADPAVFAAVGSLEPESEVEVTGLVEIDWQEDAARWPFTVPDQLNVLLRSPADVLVVRGPPWWTPARLAAALAAGGAALAAALAWVTALRRQVRSQLAVIEASLQERAIVEERRRIAREFHDSLEQDLANVALQLDAAASFAAADVRELLEQQRSLVVRLQRETRQFVWDLRDPGQAGWSFADLLAAQCREQAAVGGVPVELAVEGGFPEPPRVARYHLLKIVHEAVANALRHAGASRVLVRVGGDAGGLRVEVRDDGCGFDLARGEWLVGHFGIRGMRERAQRIGADLLFDTAPGRGTRLSVALGRDGGLAVERDRPVTAASWHK